LIVSRKKEKRKPKTKRKNDLRKEVIGMAATERELNILIKARDMASKTLAKYEDQFRDVGLALTAMGAAGTAAIGGAIKVAADFEKEMDRVGAISRATDEDLDRLTQTAIDLGASTSFSASEAAQGMQFLAMAGFDVNETIDAMPGLLATAAAGQIELGRASDIVSNVLSGFRIEAAKTGDVADVLTATFTSSNTTLESLGLTMEYVAPIATAAGYSLEEMAAATGLMGNAGIQGEKAGTALRGMIMRLQAPTDRAAEAMAELGIEVRNADGSMKSMPDLLESFQNGLKGVDKATQDAALKTIIGMESMSGFQVLLGEGSEKLREYTKELENSGGIAEEIAGKQLDNLNGALEEMWGSLETAAIVMGNMFIPSIRKASEIVTEAVRWFNNLDPAIQQTIATVAALATGFALVAGGFALFLSVAPAIGAAISMMMGPMGLLILGAGALFVAFQQNFGGIRDAVMGWIQPIIDAFGLFLGLYDDQIQQGEQFGETMQTMYGEKAMAVLGILNDFKAKVLQVWQWIQDTVLPFITEMLGQIRFYWMWYMEDIKNNLMIAWNVIKMVVQTAMTMIVQLMEWAWPWIQQIIQKVLYDVWPFIFDTFTKIMKFIDEIMPPLVQIIQWAWEKILRVVQAVMERLWPVIESAWELIKSIISAALDIVMGTIKFVLNLITGNWAEAWEGIEQLFRGIWTLISDTLIKALDLIWEAIKGSLGLIWDLIKEFVYIGVDIIGGIIEGIKSGASNLLDSIIGVIKDAIDAAKDFLGIESPSKVFMEIGGFTSEGFAEGILSAADMAKKATEDLGAAAVSGISGMRLDPGVAAGGSGMAGSGGSSTQQTVVLQFGEGSLVLPGVTNAQEFVEELQGYGLREAFKSN
jgi:TP901 family phage tail tape measure protein